MNLALRILAEHLIAAHEQAGLGNPKDLNRIIRAADKRCDRVIVGICDVHDRAFARNIKHAATALKKAVEMRREGCISAAQRFEQTADEHMTMMGI